MTLSAAVAPVLLGAALGTSFNPIAAAVSAAIAAGLNGGKRAEDRRVFAVGLLVLAWLLGDGLRLVGHARDAAGASGGAWERFGALGVWALVGFAAYLLPAWAGWYVGRRVTHGTGWLSAVAVAVSLSLAVSAAAPLVSRWLGALAG